MADRFSLKDHLFNDKTVGQLAGEYAAALPRFDADKFQNEALSGFSERELLARLDWMADCLESQLSSNFNEMANQLEAAMPAPLDPAKTDDDFGHFIHAVPGILAVRHGLEDHRARAMALLYQGTQRFSMEFYIRPFLNRWPDETLSELAVWTKDANYHVRRLVSEGTRPKLPWARGVSLRPDQTLPLLDQLASDPTRYVTRSVANHLNDLSKSVPEHVLTRLADWQATEKQPSKEMSWMTRHALRSLVKEGHSGAMAALGYRDDIPVEAAIALERTDLKVGEILSFSCEISSPQELPVLVDYRIIFSRPGGRTGEKVFKLKQGVAKPDKPFAAKKSHKIKADATTFTWHPGRHRVILQVNGVDCAEASFDLLAP